MVHQEVSHSRTPCSSDNKIRIDAISLPFLKYLKNYFDRIILSNYIRPAIGSQQRKVFMEGACERLEEFLRRKGLRFTKDRRDILATEIKLKHHYTPE